MAVVTEQVFPLEILLRLQWKQHQEEARKTGQRFFRAVVFRSYPDQNEESRCNHRAVRNVQESVHLRFAKSSLRIKAFGEIRWSVKNTEHGADHNPNQNFHIYSNKNTRRKRTG